MASEAQAGSVAAFPPARQKPRAGLVLTGGGARAAYQVGSWQGIFVPKGTPQPAVNKLYKVGVEMMKDPQVVKRLGDSGITIITSKSPADFVAFVKSETERYGKVIKDANISTE